MLPDTIELTQLVPSTLSWIGLVYLGIRTLASIIGTHEQRAQREAWRSLNDRLKELIATCDRELERISSTHERRPR